MDEILKRVIIQMLKSAGFEAVNKTALEMLMEVFSDRLTSFLAIAGQKSIHASKSNISFVDLLSLNSQMFKIGKKLPFTEEMYRECNVTAPICRNRMVHDFFSVLHIPKENYTEECIEPQIEWISPVSTKVEKFIHIYDFMPGFPPIHTFRMTPLKAQANKNLSARVKKRLEQSLSSEGNMVKLIKSSGTMPKFINFLYKGRI